MNRPRLQLYLVFTLTFLAMHFTGLMVSSLPYILNAVVSFSAVLLVLTLLNQLVSGVSFKNTIKNIGFRKTGLKSITPGIIVSSTLLLFYPLLGYLLNAEIFLAENWLLNLAGICLTGGLMEEMVFRGFLFRQLRLQMSFRRAVILSGALFTLVHLLLFVYMDWTVALMSTILAVGSSVPLAYLFERGENTVWSPALLHATIRTIGLVVTTAEQDFLPLTLAWITASLVVPYLVLLFYTHFRKIWKTAV